MIFDLKKRTYTMAYAFPAKTSIAIALGLFAVLSGCQNEKPTQSTSSLALKSANTPTSMVVTLARTAQTCWFKSKDPAFRKFRLASEVNSYAGRPRFLLVPRNKPGGLPHLVVQAEVAGNKTSGKYTKVESFGPLLQTASGKRISNDVKRWSSGNQSCKA